MKTKIISLLLVIVMVVSMLAACGGGDCDHKDGNNDHKCDECGETVSQCADADGNGKCDVCGKDVGNNNPGNTPDAPVCENHRDLNRDNKCDKCGTSLAPAHTCVDADGNGYCDDETCKKYIVVNPDIYWTDTVDLIMQMNRDSQHQELPDGGKRYLAGEDTDIEYDNIDALVAQRNADAYEATKVNIRYDYLEDGTGYGWGQNIEDIYTKAISTSEAGRPDIFVNFVYDMVSASLKGAFANLYGDQVGQGNNYFTFSTAPNAEDTGDGYMYEYMRSLTLSKHKMYVLSSDYFIDTIRAFFIVPVNVKLMNDIEVDVESVGAGEDYDYKYNSDRNGDDTFTIDDFYELVTAGEWNYKTVLEYSNAVKAEGVGNDASSYDIRDTVGFALSGNSGLSASGLLYTTSIKIINREWNETEGDYEYDYPKTNPELYDFCNKLNELIDNAKGVIVVNASGGGCFGYDAGTGSSLVAIRERFAENTILFGGVILIGSLEYQTYQDMNKSGSAGFGIVPVPLYREVNPETNAPDPYQTQIHNVGRVGGIAVKSQKFEMASAFLQYQSTHSTEILNEYYDFKLQYEVAGASAGNIAMLKYIRQNVRSSFDKAFEDAIGKFFVDVDTESNDNKWHAMILSHGYKFDGFAEEYERLIDTKKGHLYTLYNEYGRLP